MSSTCEALLRAAVLTLVLCAQLVDTTQSAAESVHPLGLSGADTTCVGVPLPLTPLSPVVSADAFNLTDRMRFDVWRQPCSDTTGFIVLLKVTPESPAPFLCGSQF